eukprot:9091144-Prorocentrum_lima.AAC.1
MTSSLVGSEMCIRDSYHHHHHHHILNEEEEEELVVVLIESVIFCWNLNTWHSSKNPCNKGDGCSQVRMLHVY